MKLIYSLSAFVAVLLLITNAHAAPLSKTVQCEVPAMKCAGCSWAVTEELKKVAGVSAVHVDWKSKKALLEIDPRKVSGKTVIFRAVKKAGYDAANYQILKVSFSLAKKNLGKSS